MIMIVSFLACIQNYYLSLIFFEQMDLQLPLEEDMDYISKRNDKCDLVHWSVF